MPVTQHHDISEFNEVRFIKQVQKFTRTLIFKSSHQIIPVCIVRWLKSTNQWVGVKPDHKTSQTNVLNVAFCSCCPTWCVSHKVVAPESHTCVHAVTLPASSGGDTLDDTTMLGWQIQPIQAAPELSPPFWWRTICVWSSQYECSFSGLQHCLLHKGTVTNRNNKQQQGTIVEHFLCCFAWLVMKLIGLGREVGTFQSYVLQLWLFSLFEFIHWKEWR